MSMRKDLKSEPKKGHYFPMRFGDAVRLVKDLALIQYDDSRIAICMKNIDHESDYGLPILRLIPEGEVTLYSLPESFDSTLAKRAAIQALEKLSVFQKESYICYTAYLTLSKKLILTKVKVSVKSAKYRSADKLSNSGFVSRKMNEVIIDEISL